MPGKKPTQGTCDKGRGSAAFKAQPGLAGTTDPSMLLPALPPSSLPRPTCPAAGGDAVKPAAVRSARVGGGVGGWHAPGGPGAQRREPRCR